MRRFEVKNARFLGTKHMHAYSITREQADQFIRDCEKPLADAFARLVGALTKPGEVGYLVIQLKNE